MVLVLTDEELEIVKEALIAEELETEKRLAYRVYKGYGDYKHLGDKLKRMDMLLREIENGGQK